MGTSILTTLVAVRSRAHSIVELPTCQHPIPDYSLFPQAVSDIDLQQGYVATRLK